MEDVQEQLALRILVDKVKNRVVFAEADKDFVDILLSFLTLPLGTIVRLVGKPSLSEPGMIGSLSTLYEGVESLDAKYLWTEACKVMLLQPRNSSEAHCRKLKVNIDDTEPTSYFICENQDCSEKSSGSLVSTYKNLSCSCGKLMNRGVGFFFYGNTGVGLNNKNVSAGKKIEGGGVFVVGTAAFIISDDLKVMPNLLSTSLELINKLGIRDTNVLEERTINITLTEILDLLKWSLLSKAPLTDLFLRKNQNLDKLKSEPSSIAQYQNPEDTAAGRKMTMKIMIRKSSSIVLFAQVAEDFIDFLFSFLTVPLGNVVNLLGSNSSFGSIDNLYQSMSVLDVHTYLRTQDLKNSLLQPSLAPQFLCENQILPVSEACNPTLYCNKTWDNNIGYIFRLTTKNSPLISYNNCVVPFTFRNPKTPIAGTTGRGGFVRGPAMFMVTDDLIVTPLSSISAVSFLNRFKIPLSDLEERVVNIGENEALSILKASLHSSSALTNGLNLVLKKPKQEN